MKLVSLVTSRFCSNFNKIPRYLQLQKSHDCSYCSYSEMVVGGFSAHSGSVELVEVSEFLVVSKCLAEVSEFLVVLKCLAEVSECLAEVSVEVSGLVSALVAAFLKGSSP